MQEPERAYERLWHEIQGCRRCLAAASIGPRLRQEPVFIPVPLPAPRPPKAPIAYLLVAAEPSASWATSQADAESKIAAGFQNFTQWRGDFVLQYAVEHWLLGQGEGYAITDLAKCAMSLGAAKAVGTKCYDLCEPFLERELALLQPRAVIAIGNKAGRRLKARALKPLVFQIAHYSVLGQAHWPTIAPNAELPTVDDLQAFIDQRRTEIPMLSRRPMANEIDRRLLGVYRQQLSEIRRSLASSPGAST